MKFDVLNRYTGKVQFTADIDCDEGAAHSIKLGLAVRWGQKAGAILSGANLSSAHLDGADLCGANLRGANLDGAILSGAILSGANLRGAILSGADLRDADLRDADLRDADLRCAHLDGAYLDKGKETQLQGRNPILMLSPIGSEDGTLFAYKTNKGLYLSRGCFFGTIKDFRLAVKAKHADNEHGVLYRAACVFIEQWATSTGNPTR